MTKSTCAAVSIVALVLGCSRRQAESNEAPPSKARVEAFSERTGERERLVREVASQGVQDERVLAALRKVPRHAFVPKGLEDLAYRDRALPIPGGQTISQPYVVAYMTEQALATQPEQSEQPARVQTRPRCLEIGTGSGYQAAILAELCAETYSIEYFAEVAAFGARNLRALGYGEDRVKLRVGDGYRGWPEAAPFDVVLVTAAPQKVPEPLLAQLAMGGRLVVPVGPDRAIQDLERWTRIAPGEADTSFRREQLLHVQFVPFVGAGVRSGRP